MRILTREAGTKPNAAAFFEQAGVPVLNVGWANDIEGVKNIIIEMAEGLGEPAKGRAMVMEMALSHPY